MLEFGTVHGATQEIRVNRLEKRLTPVIPFPHRHDFYHLVIIEAGKGWHEIDFRRYPVAPFRAYFMKPGQVHSWQIPRGTRGYVVEFGNAQRTPSAWSLDKLPDFIPLSSARERTALFSTLKRMLSEYETRARDFETVLRHSLMTVLISLHRMSGTDDKRSAEPDPLLDRFLNEVETHFRKEHAVSFYASRLGMTPKALTMRASRGLGKSARAVVQDRLLLEGKRLLAYSRLPISEVGFEIGFEDPNYFSRFFRAMAGLSPGQFRERAREG